MIHILAYLVYHFPYILCFIPTHILIYIKSDIEEYVKKNKMCSYGYCMLLEELSCRIIIKELNLFNKKQKCNKNDLLKD